MLFHLSKSRKRAVIGSTLVAATALLVAMIAMPWDLQISQWVRTKRIPGDLRRFIFLMEIFAHTLGCVMILSTLLWVDHRNRRKLWEAALFVLTCGILANLAKYLIPRRRPNTYDLEDWSWLNPERDPEVPFASSWDAWGVPLTESWFNESIRSFPSGHTATAVAMAIGLTYVYPRGKHLFLFMASVAAFQRLVAGAHYLSDIMVSIPLTLLVALAWTFLPGTESTLRERDSV
ncbi:MAG: phosphatase PAP2 family protein [Pirellula sp.]